MNIALVHYSFPPVIGGLETVLGEHARLFSGAGHRVLAVGGAGKLDLPGVEFRPMPELSSRQGGYPAVEKELSEGKAGVEFARLKAFLVRELAAALAGAGAVFVHNVLTMPFNLAATAALWELASRRPGRFVCWVHDLAACNPDYSLPHLDGDPWNLMARCSDAVRYVAVSEHRRAQFRALTGGECEVIPNGVDPVRVLGLSENGARLARDRRLFEADLVLLHPARLLRRKNVELGIRLMAGLKRRGIAAHLLVTGPADYPNPASDAYAEGVQRLCRELGVEEAVTFVAASFPVTETELVDLYQLADALFFPSRQEGFGLPLLEAALHRLPVFTSNLEPMKTLAPPSTTFFDPEIAPDALAEIVSEAVDSPLRAGRKRALREFSWEAIYRRHLEPLIEHYGTDD